MALGTKFVKGNRVEKMKIVMIIFTIYLCFLPIRSISAQVSVPSATEEEIGKIKKDLLLDIPISDVRAVERAKQELGVTQDPAGVSLISYTERNESRLAWDITFDDPINKEVLIDVINGNVLSVKSITFEERLKSRIFEMLKDRFLIVCLTFLIVCLMIIKLMKRKKEISSEVK